MATFLNFTDMVQVRTIPLSGFAGDPNFTTTQEVPDHVFVVPDLPGGGGRPSTGIAFALVLVDVAGIRVAPTGTYTYQLYTFTESQNSAGVRTVHAISVGAAVTGQAFGTVLQLTPRRCVSQKYAFRLTAFAGLPGAAVQAHVLITGL
jgi:hypothetical protein